MGRRPTSLFGRLAQGANRPQLPGGLGCLGLFLSKAGNLLSAELVYLGSWATFGPFEHKLAF